MQFFDPEKMLPAQRLTRHAKASVQISGRLCFMTDAIKMLGLTEDSRVLLTQLGEKDLALVVSEPTDIRGFEVKKSGTYFYLPLKTFYKEQKVDYKTFHIIYDIDETPETFEGKPVFHLSRRDIPRDTKDTVSRDTKEKDSEE